MGQHMNLCILPGDELAVLPDKPFPLIEWNRSHFSFLKVGLRFFRPPVLP
jgi:hypothetical protein